MYTEGAYHEEPINHNQRTPGAISSQVQIGQTANTALANLFQDYMERKAGNTRARYIQAFNGFGIFLNTLGYKNQV